MEIEQTSLDFGPPRRVLSVGELNSAIRTLLDSQFQDVWVAGEVSGVKLATSGHYYFTLKDQQSQLRCVCFRNSARYLRFKPQDGIAVLARGRIDVYEPRGEYQLLVEALEPQGFGALQLAFEQLKKKLSEEGLFDPAKKRPLPRLPQRIGIVTSPTGAVIRDMLQIFERRFPGLHIRLYPAHVQGEGSIEEVTAGIDWFSQSGWPDVVIVARGGGSLEDLWTFNEEAVARAIARSAAPVVSAVGHETDVTISDFVADLRAPTPSAAAELVIGTRREFLDRIEAARVSLGRGVRFRLTDAERRLHRQGIERASALLQRSLGRRLQRADDLDYRLRGVLREALARERRRSLDLDARLRRMDLRLRFATLWRRLEAAEKEAAERVRLRMVLVRGRLDSLSAQLAHLSPLSILDRGYAIVQDESGRVVKEAAAAPVDSALDVRLSRGRLRATVTRSVRG
jgi:exodeoxyribonuclease VII large subunit